MCKAVRARLMFSAFLSRTGMTRRIRSVSLSVTVGEFSFRYDPAASSRESNKLAVGPAIITPTREISLQDELQQVPLRFHPFTPQKKSTFYGRNTESQKLFPIINGSMKIRKLKYPRFNGCGCSASGKIARGSPGASRRGLPT